MKTMFGKRYPNCVKKEQVETEKGDGDPVGILINKVGQKKKRWKMVPN
ncbi:MAG: hypothetical protein CM15mL5_0640 [uncultured marine virus]|nr:MAG: hypothetical protein CM15mL5_0640 [uncultured marine virus]